MRLYIGNLLVENQVRMKDEMPNAPQVLYPIQRKEQIKRLEDCLLERADVASRKKKKDRKMGGGKKRPCFRNSETCPGKAKAPLRIYCSEVGG